MNTHLIRTLQKKSQEKLFGKPSQVLLETTNHCNLNCPFCMVGMQNEWLQTNGNTAHDLMTRPMGHMDEETFEKIQHELRQFGVKKVFLHFQGEPLMNKNTARYSKSLKDNNFEVAMFTNGIPFTDKYIVEFVKTGMDLIRFSVDGASEETYQQNRVGGKFAKVYKNMTNVAKAFRNTNTRVEWQFIAMRNNEHEIDLAKELANEIGIEFFVKGFRETDPDLMPLNPALRSKYLKKPCKDITHQLCIYWNGDVVPCCYDVDGKEIMGNLIKSTLDDIWRNDKYKEFRSKVSNYLNEPDSEPELCKSCLRWK